MGFQDSSTTTVDAILTKHGRLLLSQGKSLGISKFAASDDGVDYNLWNVGHPNGATSYGYAIKNMPLVEAVPDDTVVMNYKLVSLDRNTKFLPTLRFTNGTTKTIVDQDDMWTSSGIQTINQGSVSSNPNSSAFLDEGYKFTFSDESPVFVTGGKRTSMDGIHERLAHNAGYAIRATYTTEPGKALVVKAKPTDTQLRVTIIVEGNKSGAKGSVTLTLSSNIPTT